MKTDWKALAAELAAELERCRPLAEVPGCLARARAALAEPVVEEPSDEEIDAWADQQGFIKGNGDHPRGFWISDLVRAVLARWGSCQASLDSSAPESAADGPAVQSREPASVATQPSDEELLELMPETMRDEFSYAAKVCADATGNQVKPGIFRVCLNTAALEYARAVLSRWSHQPAPAAEGEVGELVAELRMMASQAAESCQFTDAESLSRAADLLERQATACAICERERLHQSTRAADLEVERQAAPVPVAAAGLCELADDLREQASQGYCEFISREDLRRVADVLEQLAVSAHKQEPAVGPPSDDELLELAQHHSVSYTMSDGSVVYPLQHGCDMRDDVLSFARAVLARYGHQPAPPAEGGVGEAALVRRMCEIILGNTFGNEELDSLALLVGHHPDVLNASTVPTEEVRELVAWLQCVAEEVRTEDYATIHSPDLPARAADLLEQRHPTPVPVSERLPGPEDYDAKGRCWLFSKVEKEWRLIDAGNPGVPHLKYCFSHWLPTTALPLPQGEVE